MLRLCNLYCCHDDGSDGRHVCSKYHGNTHYYQAYCWCVMKNCVCPSDQGELLPGTCNVNVSSAETLDIRNTVLSVIIEKEDSERTVHTLHVT